MTIGFSEFLGEVFTNPILLITIILIIGGMVVNGITDASNAIVTCVSTRAINIDYAIAIAGFMNFLGVLTIMMSNTRVAKTIYGLVNFGNKSDILFIGIISALVSVIIWSIGAWHFEIPSSESHALVSGLIGSSLAVSGFAGIGIKEFLKVFIGFFLTIILSFLFGYLIVNLIKKVCKNKDRRKLQEPFKNTQIFSGVFLAFMNGVQNGQKYLGVLFIVLSAFKDKESINKIPLYLLLIFGLAMGLGTAIGGKKIIKSIGMNLVRIENYEGFSSDMSSSLAILGASIFGLPVSTTHASTSALMGVGASKRFSNVNWSFAFKMIITWSLTFPVNIILGFLFTKLILKIW